MTEEKPKPEQPKKILEKPVPPLDAEVYIKMAKNKAAPSGRVMQELTQNKEQELERTMATIKLEQARKELDELRNGGKNMSSKEAENIATQLFKGKTPEQIVEILANMTPEMINNLQLIAQAVDTNPATMLLRQPQVVQQQPKTDNTIELLKLIIEQNAKKTDDMIAMLRLARELQPAPAPAVSSQSPLQQTMDTIKVVTEMQRPFYDSLNKKDKELADARLRELEAKMPGDLGEQIKYIKEMAPVLGLTGGQTNELDLRLEEMRENREIDLKRLDWEQKKYEMEAEADMTKWEQIGKILQGPLGNVVRDLGSAGADRVRGQGQANVHVQTGGRQPKPVQTQCPNCNKPIYVDAEAETAVCGSCGAILQKQGVPVPEQPAPTPVAVQPPQQPAQPAEEEQVDEEEEEEEETESGHNQTEGKQ